MARDSIQFNFIETEFVTTAIQSLTPATTATFKQVVKLCLAAALWCCLQMCFPQKNKENIYSDISNPQKRNMVVLVANSLTSHMRPQPA